MRPHIDGIIFSLQQHGGITVYFRELLSRFMPEHQATLTLEMPLQQKLGPNLFPDVKRIQRDARRLERLRPARVVDGASVFHSSYYRQPGRRDHPTVATVHDFVYRRFARGFRDWMRRRLIGGAIAQANHIICISEATRLDLLEFEPVRADQRVSVIHNGVSELFRPLAPASAPTKSGRPFMLFVGQRGGYKNFELALRALERLPDLELHCVGGGALRDEELAAVDASTRARVSHLGFVDDEQLNAFYNCAFCLLYPSAYEGFGIPVLEAMRAGCPVVSIDCRAVVEVGGEALCVSAQADDPAALAQAVQRLESHSEHQRFRALGFARSARFSWDRCFEQTLAVYRGF